MKKVVTFLLLVVLGLALPLSVRGASDNDTARRAAEKHNTARTHRDMKRQRRELKKWAKAMGKTAKRSKATQETAIANHPPA